MIAVPWNPGMPLGLRRLCRAGLLTIVLGWTLAHAQPIPGSAKPTAARDSARVGSIQGTVRDADSGEPLAGVSVVLDTARVGTVNGRLHFREDSDRSGVTETDGQGRFTFDRVPAGMRRVFTYPKRALRGGSMTIVNVAEGQEIRGIEVRMRRPATLSGRVFSEDGQPVALAQVYLVARVYHLGKLHGYIRGQASTDDEGNYRLDQVESGRPWLLYVRPGRGRETPAAISTEPLEPKRRKRTFAPVYYPASPEPESAEYLRLRSGEHRQGVDFAIRRAPSWCASGVLDGTQPGLPVRYAIWPSDPSYGTTRRGGMIAGVPEATTGADGRFRVCGLFPGRHVLTAIQSDPQAGTTLAFRSVDLQVTDVDLEALRVLAGSPLAMRATVRWADKAPELDPPPSLQFGIGAMFRFHFGGEGISSAVTIPAELEIPRVFPGAHEVRIQGRGPGLYVKEIRHGDASIKGQPLLVDSGSAQPIEVLVAHDAGTVGVRLRTPKGAPVSGRLVFLASAAADSEGDMADSLLSSATNQEGVGLFERRVPPGRYQIFTAMEDFEETEPEIAAMWQQRLRAPVIEVKPNGSDEVTVEVPAQ